MTTTTETHILSVHDQAVDTIQAMAVQLESARNRWESHRPDAVTTMATTLATQLARLFATGFGRDTKVFKDGDLSLVVHTEAGFVFGMVFFRLDRPDPPKEGDIRLGTPAPVEGRYCMASLMEHTSYCLKPIRSGEPTCTGHDPVIVVLPTLGDWSFHS